MNPNKQVKKMLMIDDICVSYRSKGRRVPVLQNFSLQLKQGEILAVLGPSGCGKSTLIQVLAGMLPTDSGTVDTVLDGVRLPLNPKTHKIAVIPQNCGLLPWKTVRQNCLLPLKLRSLRIDDEKNAELEEICRSLQVDSLLSRYPRELSGGQVQRTALARAFLQEPDLLLMDEPFSSLDAITRFDAWELFLKIWRQKQPTTILVTHSMEEALYLGKEIAVFDKDRGRLLEQADNPYFGQPETEDADFFKVKRRLHGLLRPADRGDAS
jgi:ABC-type nitrate/sulfonate/bicarbonate transport system ATPase subunit